jgi:hypothetical protein
LGPAVCRCRQTTIDVAGATGNVDAHHIVPLDAMP